MKIQKNKIYLLLFLIFLFFSCQKEIKIKIEDNRKYIYKKMNSKLVINLKSNKEKTLHVNLLLHNLIDDIADMPIFKKELSVYPGKNIFIINLKEIGTGKYGLRLYYKKDLIDYRILEISP